MKEIYKLSPPMQKSSRTTALFIIISLFVCAILLKLSTYLPAAWIFEILIIILCAAWINKILKQGVFTLTYILYEESLKFYTRYGFIEKETASFPLDNAEFFENTIIYKGKAYPFFPDEKLKSLLNIQISS